MDLNAELAARHAAIGGPGGLRAGRRMARIGNLTTLGTAILMWPVLALGSSSGSPAGHGANPAAQPAAVTSRAPDGGNVAGAAIVPVGGVAVRVATRQAGPVHSIAGGRTGAAIRLASASVRDR